MSRRTKRASEEFLRSTWAEVRDPSRNEPAQPSPPRPNKPLLITSIILLAAWIIFLIVLAATS